MAKYAENVNKQSKIIDIQKQFPGGLKTVDTDDALGKVYLREAENVSLSEFSFLEKRYGLAEEEEFLFDTQPPNLDRIQGYFEFSKRNENNEIVIDKILFVDGSPYIKVAGDTVYRLKEIFYEEEGFVYPDFTGTPVLENLTLSIAQDEYELTLFASVSGLTVIADNAITTEIENLDLSISIDNTITTDFVTGSVFNLGEVNLGLSINPGIDPEFTPQPSYAYNNLNLGLSVSNISANVLEDSLLRAKLTEQTFGDFISTGVQFQIDGPGTYSDQLQETVNSTPYQEITVIPNGQFDLTVNTTSSFEYSGTTYNFNRFIINGVPQSTGDNDVTLSISGDVDVEILYNTLQGV